MSAHSKSVVRLAAQHLAEAAADGRSERDFRVAFLDVVNAFGVAATADRPSYAGDVHEFLTKFGLLPADRTPHSLPREDWKFRVKLMTEELREYVTAENLLEELDALVDLVYVAVGTAISQGFDFDEAWQRVHAANLQKVRALPDGSNSARSSGQDVVKPPGWRTADLSDLVGMEAPGIRRTS